MSSGRVLVVDDDAATLDAMSGILEEEGFEVRSATNGAVAIEHVLTFRPEVIVFDFWMPVSDGRELVHGLREVARARVGLVAISGTPEVEDWCGRVGVGWFLRKPFGCEQLLSIVNKALDETRTPSIRGLAASPRVTAPRSPSRAVLLVGGDDDVLGLRRALRESGAPLQVALIERVDEAIRALTSVAVDVIAICGHAPMNDPSLPTLVVESAARGVAIVFETRPSEQPPAGARVYVCSEPGIPELAKSIREAIGS